MTQITANTGVTLPKLQLCSQKASPFDHYGKSYPSQNAQLVSS